MVEGRSDGSYGADALREFGWDGKAAEGWHSAGAARAECQGLMRAFLEGEGVGLEVETEAAGLHEALSMRWGVLEGQDTPRTAARLWWYALLCLRAEAYEDDTPSPERVRAEAFARVFGPETTGDALESFEGLGDYGRDQVCRGWRELDERLEEAYLELSLIEPDPAFQAARHPLDDPTLGWAERGLLLYLEREDTPVRAQDLVTADRNVGGTLDLLRRLYQQGRVRAYAQGMAALGLAV